MQPESHIRQARAPSGAFLVSKARAVLAGGPILPVTYMLPFGVLLFLGISISD